MFKKCLDRAINYYSDFNYLTIANQDGIIEYSAVYCKDKNCFINERVSGKHILEVYPSLNENTSTLLKALNTGEEQYDTVQELIYFNGDTYYLLSSDFPIIVDNKTIGVIEVSVSLSQKKYREYIDGKSVLLNKRLCNLDDLITEDENFISMKEKIKRISKTDSSVLIYGETGTGKDIIAQSIHYHSNRRNNPFICQNCAAIPSTLLESTFFGTVKGAYTGAEDTVGLFELAKGGTLFLDEINSMDIGIQAKILRAIEGKIIRRIGDTKDIKTDVRIVSAMNKKPEDVIKEGKLREDLFYRLSVVQIEVPPLRKRKGDIIVLSDFFIKKFNNEMGMSIEGLSEIVKNIFLNYDWPGNVRELRNVIEAAFNLCQNNIITVKDIPNYIYKEEKNTNGICNNIIDFNFNTSLQEKVDGYEEILIRHALDNSKTLTEAAKKLQISCQSLHYKLKKYKIE